MIYTRACKRTNNFITKHYNLTGPWRWNTLSLVRGLTKVRPDWTQDDEPALHVNFWLQYTIVPTTLLCTNLRKFPFQFLFFGFHGSVLFGLAFIRQTGSAGFNGEPTLEAKDQNFTCSSSNTHFGVLYKPMVIVTDGQLLEAGKATQTNALFFGLCCQLILTTIFLIICLLCPLPVRLVGRHVF